MEIQHRTHGAFGCAVSTPSVPARAGGSKAIVAMTVAAIVAACGGRTEAAVDHPLIDGAVANGGQGCGGAVDSELVVRDARVWCNKEVQCGEAASLSDCEAARPQFRCCRSSADISACLDTVERFDCSDLMVSSGRSCLAANKSVDGC
jgi:hypothetical protein